jgi:hypothetical protein
MDPIPSPEPFAGPLAPDDPSFAARSGRCSSARSGGAHPLAAREDIPREAMRVAAFIVRRMALDMQDIHAIWGYVEPWHLHQRGWSPHQVLAYGQLAAEQIASGRAASGASDHLTPPERGAHQKIPTFTRTEIGLASFSIIGALALMLAGIVEISRPGTLPALNAAVISPAPQTVALPVCRPEGA